MLTQERLKQLLSYNPATGEWYWLKAPLHNTRRNGKRAGNQRRDGYRLIRIGGVAHYSSRLAFLYMTGKWPQDEVDHKDRNPSNDRWDNLREATSSLNKFNRGLDYDGFRGVYPCGKKWQVQVGGSYLGVYEDLDEALAIRDAVAVTMAGEFALLNTR